MIGWYPKEKEELDGVLNEYLKTPVKRKKSEVHGLIVPHAGYLYSGEVAGKAYSLLKDSEIKKAVILGPSHYVNFYGVHALANAVTPLGNLKVTENDFEKLEHEHSVDNQLPFLKKLGFNEVLPLVIGEIGDEDAHELAGDLSKLDAVFIFSTDLSHFLTYEQAVKQDRKTIELIKSLDTEKWKNIDACGKFPLRVAMHLCKIMEWKPGLIEYKNSGDIIGDKNRVVGYASLVF